MPKATRIKQWRDRQQKRRGREKIVARRVTAIILFSALFGLTLLLVAAAAGITVAYARNTSEVPAFTELVAQREEDAASWTPSTIYAWRDHDLTTPVPIYQFSDPLAGEAHWQPLSQIPQVLIDATVAFEEPEFWREGAFSNLDLGLSLYRIPLRRPVDEGKATILRKVVRSQLMGVQPNGQEDRLNLGTVPDLLKESLLIHRIDNSYSREEILEWYLNTAYYGNLAFGFEAAARVYFGKPAAELSLAEATMLAAIPDSPSSNPIDDPEEARSRQAQVLDALVESGNISRDASATIQFSEITIAPALHDRFDVIAPHFALYVRRQLEGRYGPEALMRQGLQVYTTLDLTMQQQAECLARAHLRRLSGDVGAELAADERGSCHALQFLEPISAADVGIDYDVNNAAVVVMDAETAAIRAMVGSLNYWDERINGSTNFAVDQMHQPGTSAKPFIYLTALSQGYTPATMVLDIETDFGTPAAGNSYVPRNDDGQFHGPMRLREGLGNGYNVPAVQVMSWVGVEKVLSTAQSMGITTLEKPGREYGLSFALGGGDVTLLEMVYAYSVMNNMGQMLGQPRLSPAELPGERTLDPIALWRVEDSQGRLVDAFDQAQRREILTPQLAYLMNDMLSDRSARCENLGCPNVLELPANRPAAVTTGNTNDFRDAWTIGYTPQLVIGVWVGNGDDRATVGLTGYKGAAPIWQALMSWATQDAPIALWTQPPGLVELAVCDLSGLLATSFCPTVSELFIAGTQPTVRDSIYQEFTINRDTGRLATIYTPPELVEHRTYLVFPSQAAAWARENGFEEPPAEYDTIIVDPARSGNALIIRPQSFSAVSGSVEIVGTASGDDFRSYRLAYFKGLNPSNVQVIVEEETQAKVNDVLGTWDVTNLDGLYTMLLTVLKRDGRFEEYSAPVTVDNTAPIIEIRSPVPEQRIDLSAERVSLRVRAEDNIAVTQVRFFLDAAAEPFAASQEPPYSAVWRLRSAGCHVLTAEAIDAAGNSATSSEVAVCVTQGN